MEHEKVLEQYIAATNTHDFTNVRKVLHENVVYWFTDKTCVTMAEIQAYFEHAWEMIAEEVYSATNIQWLTVDERSATCIYTYHYQGYHNGKFVSGSGRATNIFIKTSEDEWKLIHEHLSPQ
ncbi:SnoaL-like domain-containing protein [Evansella caseinilytica]|uniref:SnoaL-like domain-containing protein n=1 Tax=Evansella caseinilytica TaxID=1503961 RepID=A0A1H3STS5_9BACI|nr:nuclear transport factor 2 family protein [Evansella caseinilytica]SDZ41386.1 SnoaL-like domain-containing protein [Evansella caseinilytica]